MSRSFHVVPCFPPTTSILSTNSSSLVNKKRNKSYIRQKVHQQQQSSFSIKNMPLLRSFFVASHLISAAAVSDVEIPTVFNRRDVTSCDENAVVASWCDSRQFDDLECGILKDFDQYGCQCKQDPSKCPDECVGGSELVEKTHYGIICRNLPHDSPNYILKEYHHLHRCEGNAVVASWCDDWINPHLECALYPEIDQYLCRCSGKAANCPMECIDGSEPLVFTVHETPMGAGSVLCSGIPVDSPNYILKETL
jgi:hypothetical protein